MQDKKMYEPKKGASSPFNNSLIYIKSFLLPQFLPEYRYMKRLKIC